MTRKLVAILMIATLCGAASLDSAAREADLVLVAGATGRTGVQAVTQLAAKGYRVRALVRDADKARATLPGGTDIVVGDVRDPASLAAAMQGVTHVISAIGGGGRNPAAGNGPDDIDRQGNINLVDAALAAGASRFVLVSSVGVEQAETYPMAFMRPILAAKRASEEYLRASGLPYTIVQPGGLIDEAGEHRRVVLRQEAGAEPGRIARADLARVSIAALGSTAALGKTFEVLAVAGEPVDDLAPLFTALRADAPPAR